MAVNVAGQISPPANLKKAFVVALDIVESLVRTDAQPDHRLPSEAEMLLQYRVSRGTLREALRVLEHHGIIRIKPGPGGGPVVVPVSRDAFARSASLHFHVVRASYRDLFEARLIIEPAMARLVAQQQRHDVLERVTAVIELGRELRVAKRRDERRLGAVAALFHDELLHGSGNRILDLVGGSLLKLVVDASPDQRVYAARNNASFDSHEEIFRHLKRGNASSVERLVRDHIQELFDGYEETAPEFLSEFVRWRH
jgi:DNA-binding FadR family transcriptional regulator